MMVIWSSAAAGVELQVILGCRLIGVDAVGAPKDFRGQMVLHHVSSGLSGESLRHLQCDPPGSW